MEAGTRSVYISVQVFSVFGMFGAVVGTLMFLTNETSQLGFVDGWIGFFAGALAFSISWGLHSFTSDKLGYSLLGKIADAFG